MPSNKLFIGNLPYQATSQDLEQLFSSCGEIVNVHIPIDRESGKPRGFGFVEMATVIEAVEAIHQLNGVNLGGRDITVIEAVDKKLEPNRPYAKNMGKDVCILCQKHNGDVFGFEEVVGGVCASCISSLSKASRPPRSNNPQYRPPRRMIV